MGLTLHYELRAPASWPAERIDQTLVALRQEALAQRFEEVSELRVDGTVCDQAIPWSHALCFWAEIVAEPWESDSPAFTGDPATARAFFVNPGEQCESASFGFLKRFDATGAPAEWFWYCHCKTQYASIVSDEHFIACHTGLVAVLDLAATLGVDVVVHDEGRYWETRDTSTLVSEVHAMNRLIARFAGALTDRLQPDADGVDHCIETPIFEHRRFERLEMGQDE